MIQVDAYRSGGFLGAWTLTRDMPEVALYREACQAVFDAMPSHPSIVSASILSAIGGEFGDYHATRRTAGSTLFINALMSLYWCFRLDPVARRILYLDEVRETQSYLDVTRAIERYRNRHISKRPWNGGDALALDVEGVGPRGHIEGGLTRRVGVVAALGLVGQ